MTTVNKIVSAFLATLFLTGLLATAPATAAESVKSDTVNDISAEEHFSRYES